MNPRIQSALNTAAETALMHFGTPEQINATIEELGECVAALSRLRNRIKGNTPENRMAAVEEVADVTIMMAQMRLVFGGDLIDGAILRKLEKLGAHIEVVKAQNLAAKKETKDGDK